MFSDDAEAHARPGDILSRGEQFHFEAIRLWNLQEGRASLVNLQAILIIQIEFVCNTCRMRATDHV